MSSDYERIRQDNIREYGEGTRHLDFLQRLYAERTHFIFELLQNAEDAAATQVTFALDRRRLVVHHDGRPFNEQDVRGICGVSLTTKDDKVTAIGKFGIGFKSVYAYTTLPEVHSGEEHFRIRHYVRPEPATSPDEPPNGQTMFVFPFDRDDPAADIAHDEITAGLQGLDPSVLLFLQNVHSITFESAGQIVHLTRIRDDADPTGVELIRRDNERVVLHQYWRVFQRPVDHIGFPGRRVEIAFKRTGADPDAPIERLPRSPLVAYFPTSKETRLGFLLQAPLRTTPARDNVPEQDGDNLALVDEAARLLVDTLQQLRDAGRFDLDVLHTLPIDPEAFPDGGMLRRLYTAVRDALRNLPLLPTADETRHVRAAEMRLARGAGIRELLSPAQLGALAGEPSALHWQPAQLTRERDRTLWDYLRQDLGIDEVTPEWIVAHLDIDFLRSADDALLIRLYAFLDRSPALWRAPRTSYERPGPARALPLVRLEDGNHVTPFDPDGRPNAYLPEPSPSAYPTVRRTLVTNSEARSFLKALGLQEPDAIDEVLEKVLPRYQLDAPVIDDDQHDRDLTLIGRALDVASRQRRVRLIDRLHETAFLLARTADRSAVGYHRPTECYWADDELEHYFLPSHNAWFLDPRYQKHRSALNELGVADDVRVRARSADPSGHVVLRDFFGDHSRGLDGFDPDLHIDGFEAALSNPDSRRSTFVWNRLLVPRADRLQGVVESSTRAEYINATPDEIDTEPHRLAVNRAWLPAPGGGLARPEQLALDDLPEDYRPDQRLASGLNMITSVIREASNELGISVEILRFLSDNPDRLAKLAQQVNDEPQPKATAPPSPADQHQDSIDYTTELRNVFTKPADNGHEHDQDWRGGGGQITAPLLRRERLAAAINDARVVEPATDERFRFVPRKVWDGKNPAVRQFMLEQYHGHCQICDATFPKRDGEPYFEVAYLVAHVNAAWIDRPGNVLCLCPTCTAKLHHGEVHAADILDQIRAWRTSVEGGDQAALHIKLCGRPQSIHYTEKHLLDLQTLVGQTDVVAPFS